jgi:predicted pyridoxine 5'-phosphate oxidase superfamily flavin-nucleotide-binding protein
MTTITDEMRELIKRAILSFVATVNEDNTPNLSPKASLTVRDDKLYFANIGSPMTVRNLRRNPAIEINVVDIFRRRGFRFKGNATVFPPDTSQYDAIARWVWSINGDAYPVHDVVEIYVTEAKPLLSPAYIYGGEVKEDEIKESFMTKYGVHTRTAKGGSRS